MPVKKQSELGAILERLKKSESSAYFDKELSLYNGSVKHGGRDLS